MDSAVAILSRAVALDMGDDELLGVEALGCGVGDGVLDKLDEELARLLWPSGCWAAPFLTLGMVWDTLGIFAEWNSALVVDDLLEEAEGLLCVHPLDQAACLKHILEVNSLLLGPSLSCVLVVAVEGIVLTHLS